MQLDRIDGACRLDVYDPPNDIHACLLQMLSELCLPRSAGISVSKLKSGEVRNLILGPPNSQVILTVSVSSEGMSSTRHANGTATAAAPSEHSDSNDWFLPRASSSKSKDQDVTKATLDQIRNSDLNQMSFNQTRGQQAHSTDEGQTDWMGRNGNDGKHLQARTSKTGEELRKAAYDDVPATSIRTSRLTSLVSNQHQPDQITAGNPQVTTPKVIQHIGSGQGSPSKGSPGGLGVPSTESPIFIQKVPFEVVSRDLALTG